MAIKAIFATSITAILATGCVAFPEDGYDSRGYGYGQPVQRSYGYDQGYDYRYDRDNDRSRWERERAYRLKQERLDQQRRQYQLDQQRKQYDQARRDQIKRQQFEQAKRDQIQRQQLDQTKREEIKKRMNEQRKKSWGNSNNGDRRFGGFDQERRLENRTDRRQWQPNQRSDQQRHAAKKRDDRKDQNKDND